MFLFNFKCPLKDFYPFLMYPLKKAYILVSPPLTYTENCRNFSQRGVFEMSRVIVADFEFLKIDQIIFKKSIFGSGGRTIFFPVR